MPIFGKLTGSPIKRPDRWLTPDIWLDDDIKFQAVNLILKSFQGWRNLEETVLPMNPQGLARLDEFENNLDRLFHFTGKNRSDQHLFIRGLKDQVAVADRPVRMDPFSVCRICRLG